MGISPIYRVVSTTNIRVDWTVRRLLRRMMDNEVRQLEGQMRVSFGTAFSGLGVYGNFVKMPSCITLRVECRSTCDFID
jgi:hypothetical protein